MFGVEKKLERFRINIGILSIFLTFLLSGCGFHFRGDIYSHLPFHRIRLISPTPYGELEQALRTAFAHIDVDVTESERAPLTLIIHSSHLHHNTPSIGSSSQTRVFTFNYDVIFTLENSNHQPLLSNHPIHVTHHIAVPRGQLLSTNNQVDILKRHMIHDAIIQLFHRLETTEVRDHEALS